MNTVVERSELPFIDNCSGCGDNAYQEVSHDARSNCDNSCPINNNDNSCPSVNEETSCQACVLPGAVDNSVVGGGLGIDMGDSSAVSPVINNVPVNITRRPVPGPGCSSGVLYVDRSCGDNATAAPQNSLRKYSTLNAAVQAASSGNKIQVAPGAYTLSVNVRNKDLIIEGSGESTSIVTDGVTVQESRIDLISARLGVGKAGFDLRSAELNLSNDIIDASGYLVKADATSSFSAVDNKINSTTSSLFVASKYSIGRVNNNFITLDNAEATATIVCPPAVAQIALYDIVDDAEVGTYALHQFNKNSVAWLGNKATDITLVRFQHRATPNLTNSKVVADVSGNAYDAAGSGTGSYTLLDLSAYADNDVSSTVAGNTWTGAAVASTAFRDLVAGSTTQRYIANVAGNTFSSNGLVFAKDLRGRFADLKSDSSKTLDTSYDGRTWYARKSLVSTPADVADLTAQHVMYFDGAGARTETLPYVEVTPSVDNNYPGRNLMLSNFSNATMKFKASMGNSIATNGKVYTSNACNTCKSGCNGTCNGCAKPVTTVNKQVVKSCGCGNTCKSGCNGCAKPITVANNTTALNNATAETLVEVPGYYLYLGPKTSMLLSGVNGKWYKNPHFV